MNQKNNNIQIKITNFIEKVEKEINPVVEFFVENEEVIKISGNLWNQFFSTIHKFNSIKDIIFNLFESSQRIDFWKAIYESEKSNLNHRLQNLINENQKLNN